MVMIGVDIGCSCNRIWFRFEEVYGGVAAGLEVGNVVDEIIFIVRYVLDTLRVEGFQHW